MMSNKPKKAVWDSCLDKPIPKGKPAKIKLLRNMREIIEEARREDTKNEANARQYLKNIIIK